MAAGAEHLSWWDSQRLDHRSRGTVAAGAVHVSCWESQRPGQEDHRYSCGRGSTSVVLGISSLTTDNLAEASCITILQVTLAEGLAMLNHGPQFFLSNQTDLPGQFVHLSKFILNEIPLPYA